MTNTAIHTNHTGTTKRILDRVHASCGATSIGLLASDLKLAHQTVKRYVTAMIREGYVEVNPNGGLLTTIAYQRALAFDAAANRLLAR